MAFDLIPEAGERVEVTIDCFTSCGSISMANVDRSKLMSDVAIVRQLERTMWIIREEESEE